MRLESDDKMMSNAHLTKAEFADRLRTTWRTKIYSRGAVFWRTACQNNLIREEQIAVMELYLNVAGLVYQHVMSLKWEYSPHLDVMSI